MFAPFVLLTACLLAFAAARPVAAQDDALPVVGTVVNEAGEPVPGAQVVFTRLDPPDTIARITVTNQAGRFRINLPPGRYRWEARAVGARVQTGEVEVSPAQISTFTIRVASGASLIPGLAQSKYFNLSDVNYFSTGFDFAGEDGRPLDESANQIKFHIALRYKIAGTRACDSCRSGLYATYSQTSFWHFYDDSAPFFDNNYSPGALLYLTLGRDGADFQGFALYGGIVHESNGRDEPYSRGWQRNVVGVTYGAVNRTGVSATLAVWDPWGLEDTNPDLTDYAGRGELTVFYHPALQAARGGRVDPGPVTLQLRSRVLGSRLVSNAELNVLVDVPPFLGIDVMPQLFAQVFHGYAENLLTYDEKRTVVRVGLGLLR